MDMLGLKLKLGFMSGSAMPALMLNFISTATLDPRITFSRGTNGMVTDATGKLTYAPNNLLLNSDTLSTQSVTTAAISYILSFQGTGSIALSGAYSGSLAGTGATDRVYLKFTSTAASLTLTVTGSVTSAQLEAVTYQTTPGTYNATTSAAYYGPRFDYDPTTLAAKGLLIEEARTNLLTYSQEFDNAAWTKLNATAAANAATSPDGTLNADTLSDGTATDNHGVRPTTLTLANSTTYTMSVYAKFSSLRYIILDLVATSSTATYSAVLFDIQTGVVASSAASGSGYTVVSSSIQNVGNGWHRCIATLTIGSIGTALQAYIGTSSSGVIGNFGLHSYTGTNQTAYIYGAQLEAGSFATSYIPTAASSATRNADVATMTGANFSSWYNQTQGTWCAQWMPYAVTGTVIAQISASTNNDRFQMLNDNGGQTAITTGGVGQGGIDAGTITALAANKLAFAYATNDAAASLNGGAAGLDATVTLPAVDRLCIGATVTLAGFLNGHIRSISYYNSRLPNTTLQSYSV